MASASLLLDGNPVLVGGASLPDDGVTDFFPWWQAALAAAQDGSKIVFSGNVGLVTASQLLWPNTMELEVDFGDVKVTSSFSGVLPNGIPAAALGVLNMQAGSRNPRQVIRLPRLFCANGASGIEIRNSVNIKLIGGEFHDGWIAYYLHNTDENGFPGYSEQCHIEDGHVYDCASGMTLDPDTGGSSFQGLRSQVTVESMASSPNTYPNGINVKSGAGPYQTRWDWRICLDKNNASGVIWNGSLSDVEGHIGMEQFGSVTGLVGLSCDPTMASNAVLVSMITEFMGFSGANTTIQGAVPGGWQHN